MFYEYYLPTVLYKDSPFKEVEINTCAVGFYCTDANQN